MGQRNAKNLWIALLLNLAVPGLGYIHYGRVRLGLLALLIISPVLVLTKGAAWFGWGLVMAIDMYFQHRKYELSFEPEEMRNCPACTELIVQGITICPHCRAPLDAIAAAASHAHAAVYSDVKRRPL